MPQPTMPNSSPQYGDAIKRQQLTQAVPIQGQPAGMPVPQASPPSPPPAGSAPSGEYSDPFSQALRNLPPGGAEAEWRMRILAKAGSDPQSSPLTRAIALAAKVDFENIMTGKQMENKDSSKPSDNKDK